MNAPPRGALAAAFLWLTGFAAAQDLRLGDILTSRTLEAVPATATLSGERLDLALAQARADLDAGDFGRAAESAELLRTRVPPGDPDYPEVLWLRAAALEGTGDHPGAARAAADYLSRAPRGPHWAGCHRIAARADAMAGNWAGAAPHFTALLEESPNPSAVLGAEGLLAAAETFSEMEQPAAARMALRQLGKFPDLSTSQRQLSAYWLLESLLIEDDAEVTLPEAPVEGLPLADSITLRRALLLELRGQNSTASALYHDLAWRRAKLPAAEAVVLDERLERVEKSRKYSG